MRFTFEPLGDLEVSEGLTLAECRADLHRLTGTTPGVRLAIGDVPLVDDQVAGVAPWVAGCTVEVVGRRPRAADAPSSAGWQLVVLAGPDAGAAAVPDADGLVVVGRGGRSEPGRLALADARASPWHAVVRSSGRSRSSVRARWSVLSRWSVRDAGSTTGTVRVRRGRRRRIRSGALLGLAGGRLGPLGTSLRPGDRLLLGGTTVELRRDGTSADRHAHGPGRAASGDDRDSPPGPTPVLGWVVPAATSGVLALVTRNPVYLLFALTGPAVVALPALLRHLRRRRAEPWRPSLGSDPATATALLADGIDERPAWWPLAVEGLAVVGDDAGAVARALVGTALLSRDLDLAVLHTPAAAVRWAWCRWLEGRLGPAPRARVARSASAAGAALHDHAPRSGQALLVVSDGVAAWRTSLDRWWLRGRHADDGVLVLAADPADVPAWCRWVAAGGMLTGPGGSWPTPPPSAGRAWAERHARAVAAADAARPLPRTRAERSAELPARVSLADLVPADLEAVRHAWTREPDPGSTRHLTARALSVPLGVGLSGTVVVDLVADGPHALVAGTTGSGKSELVQSLVLGLALRHPPTDLAMVLLDFKGGAGLGRCRDLPHVVGQVDDLDPDQARRALEGLRTELRRREAVLAAAGVVDIAALGALGRTSARPGAPTVATLPRLLVVVDEFRAMSEDLPDFVPGLVRLAAQGRSLGFHLVLATQRPGGAVSQQMRANLALRICLRVTEPADSIDVLEVADAATLPQDRPGRALVRRGSGPVEELQAAWAAREPTPDAPRLHWAPDWSTFGTDAAVRTLGVPPSGHGSEDQVALLVHAAVTAAEGTDRPAPIWSPPLPSVVSRADLTAGLPAAPTRTEPCGTLAPGGARAGRAVVLGLTDPAGSQGRGLLEWDGRGLALAAGRRGSGRSTVASTVTDAALDAGWTVHRVHRDAVDVGSTPSPGLGTVVGTADPRRIARLLGLLLVDPPEHRHVLVLDDLGAVVRALDRIPRGLGLDLLDRLLRERPDLGVLATGEPRDLARWVPLAAFRLVLAVQEPGDDLLLGVPRTALRRSTPGRALHVDGESVVLCQIAVSEGPGRGASAPLLGAPHRLAPLPVTVRAGDPADRPEPQVGHDGVVIGVGGDDASDVLVDVSRGLLVVGPAGTGRSTALMTVAEALRSAGRRVATIARDGPLAGLSPGGWSADPSEAGALVRRCAGPGSPEVLVVDDLDLLARTDPVTDDELAGRVHGGIGPVLVAAARTDRAASAYRGACAALRGSAALLVLAPLEPGSQDVAGRDLALAADPARPRHPGRGVLVDGRGLTPVQVAVSAARARGGPDG